MITLPQLATLKHFDETERRLDGLLVDWQQVDYRTITALDQLRARLNTPTFIIRETHPNRPGAIDATCPSVPLSFVFMQGLLRINEASFGLYSGNSFHLDFRADDGKRPWPARWMAVKPSQRSLLVDRGLLPLIEKEQDGWIYLHWNHARSFEALALVFELSERLTKGGTLHA